MAVLARGARRSRRRFPGALESCALIRAEVALGRGELGRLAQAQVVRAFPGVLADLAKLTIAGAALELVREAVAVRQPDEHLFETTLELLALLDSASDASEGILLSFEARVLALVGLAPQVDACGPCGKEAPADRAALFSPASGGIICRSCGGGPIRLSAGARHRVRESTGPQWAAAGSTWPRGDLAGVRRALTELVAHHLARELAGPKAVSQVDELVRRGGR